MGVSTNSTTALGGRESQKHSLLDVEDIQSPHWAGGNDGFRGRIGRRSRPGEFLRPRNLTFPPVGSKNHEKHSLPERQEATEWAGRGLDFPAGRKNPEILSLLEKREPTDGAVRGMVHPAGRKNPEILSLLDLVGDVEDGVEEAGLPAGSGKHKIISCRTES